MAVLKVKRSNSLAQHNAQPNAQHNAQPNAQHNAQTKPQHTNPAQPVRRRPNPLATPQLYDVLNNLNRGYGTVLISLDNLELMNTATRPQVLPAECLRDLRNRTEELRALANRELLAADRPRDTPPIVPVNTHEAGDSSCLSRPFLNRYRPARRDGVPQLCENEQRRGSGLSRCTSSCFIRSQNSARMWLRKTKHLALSL